MTDEIRNDPQAAPVVSAQPRRPAPDKFAARRAEIKRQKRKTHRRRINASNRPG